MKRTRLKRMSDKKRKENAACNPPRRFYVENAEACELCETEPATDCHEICAGSSRHRSVWKANTWLALCRPCHGKVQGLAIEKQYRIKLEAVKRDINWCLGRNLL